MALPFARPQVLAEPAEKRLTWEWKLLGQPVSVHPLDMVAGHRDAWPTLGQVPLQPGTEVELLAVRLPGWTGGQGFFLGDRATFVMARSKEGQQQPRPWVPLQVRGLWLDDGWGACWLQVGSTEELEDGRPHEETRGEQE